jgi:hypothetical protein
MREVDAILTGWYSGEVGGNALFSTLAGEWSVAAADKWRALAAVEATVASSLATVLRAQGIPLPVDAGVEERARRRCDAIAGKSWPETMHWLHHIAEVALEKMRADAGRLPPELSTVGDLVVRHEIALLDFAALELAGRPAESLPRLEAFLGSLA